MREIQYVTLPLGESINTHGMGFMSIMMISLPLAKGER